MAFIKKILFYITLIFIVGIFSYLYFVNRDIAGRYQRMKEAEKEFENIVNEVNDLAREKKKLEEEVFALKQDSEKQEEKARRDGWVRAGEKVIRLKEKQ